MNLLKGGPHAYEKMDIEDQEDVIHRRAQFLIYKALEQADNNDRSRRKRGGCFLRVMRICRLKIRIGKRLKKLRKSILFNISIAKVGVHTQVLSQFKVLKHLFSSKDANIVSLPPLFT